jgi:hypothetical protein
LLRTNIVSDNFRLFSLGGIPNSLIKVWDNSPCRYCARKRPYKKIPHQSKAEQSIKHFAHQGSASEPASVQAEHDEIMVSQRIFVPLCAHPKINPFGLRHKTLQVAHFSGTL